MLPFVKRNATETIIQNPISLASSLVHAPAIATDICVLNKRIFFTLNHLYLPHEFKTQKRGCQAMLMKRFNLISRGTEIQRVGQLLVQAVKSHSSAGGIVL